MNLIPEEPNSTVVSVEFFRVTFIIISPGKNPQSHNPCLQLSKCTTEMVHISTLVTKILI